MDFLFWGIPMWVYLLYVILIIIGMALLAKRVKKIREERDQALEAVGWLQAELTDNARELSQLDWLIVELKDKLFELEQAIKHLNEDQAEQGEEESAVQPEEIAIRVHVLVRSPFDGYDLQTDGYEDTLQEPLTEWTQGLEKEIEEL